MSENEFVVLDELYFVLSFNELIAACGLETKAVVETLGILHTKGWVKILKNRDEEADDPVSIQNQYSEYFYLASKEGLLAHNTI